MILNIILIPPAVFQQLFPPITKICRDHTVVTKDENGICLVAANNGERWQVGKKSLAT